MSATSKVLVLGPYRGWHAEQLLAAAQKIGITLEWAKYESLRAHVGDQNQHEILAELVETERVVRLETYDCVLTRTMPVGSLEQITLRLGTLHSSVERGISVVNPPATLELAIDKYRTLARLQFLGLPVPPTRVVQTRKDAMEAYRELGGDVVVKPVFGGEGRGILRVMDAELAWFTFATLDRIDAVLYLQQFIPPGGTDLRLLVSGDEVFGFRRIASQGWKTNVSLGARTEPVDLSSEHVSLARRVASDFGLVIGSVDLIEGDAGPVVVEVNAIPGWRGAQRALGFHVAEHFLTAALAASGRTPCPT